MDIQRMQERMEEFMGLQSEFRSLMMSCTAGRVDETAFGKFDELEAGLERLLNDTMADDSLVTADDLSFRIADLVDWRARAFETSRQFDDAIREFDRAANLFESLGKSAEAQRSRDKAGELRMEVSGDLDAEIERLMERLESAVAGSLDHMKILISLGEIHSRANDDVQAVRYLKEAESELLGSTGRPSDAEVLGALRETVEKVFRGEEVPGLSTIEDAMERRALIQRLLLALGNAYRVTNPELAEKYLEMLRSFDDGKNSDLRQLLGQYLDSGEDVQAFLEKYNADKS